MFTQTNDQEDRNRFLALLIAAVDVFRWTDVGLFSPCGRTSSESVRHYPELNAFMNDNLCQITPMNEEELRSAISYPAQLAGLVLEEGLEKPHHG